MTFNADLWVDMKRSYTVRAIMTPLKSLTCWENGSEKKACVGEDGDLRYDVIPIVKESKIIGLMTKNEPFKLQPLEKDWLVTHDSPIPDLVDIFITTNKPAFLVLYGNEVIGIVSPADLNKLPTRIYFYSLIGEVELILSNLIRDETDITTDIILERLDEIRSGEILERLERLRIENVEIDVIHLLYFSDIIKIIAKTPSLRKKLGYHSEKQAERGLKRINDLRNKTMHLVKPILEKMPYDLDILQDQLHRVNRIINLTRHH